MVLVLLKILVHRLVAARVDGQRRFYRLRPEPLVELDAWLEPYRQLWNNSLDRLDRLGAPAASAHRPRPQPPSNT